MQYNSSARTGPLSVNSAVESKIYSLLGVAMTISALGAYAGMLSIEMLMRPGMLLVLLIAELSVIFTSRLWMSSSPLNYVLFAVFPFLSGLTLAPFLMVIMSGYANGGTIIVHAFAATAFMTFAMAVFARSTSMNLSFMGRALFFALLGLIFIGVLQVFVPGLRSTSIELLVSGAGIVVFAGFIAYDIQRVQEHAHMGANPFLLALSLYLDIFNLFLYILRFMVALSGNDR